MHRRRRAGLLIFGDVVHEKLPHEGVRAVRSIGALPIHFSLEAADGIGGQLHAAAADTALAEVANVGRIERQRRDVGSDGWRAENANLQHGFVALEIDDVGEPRDVEIRRHPHADDADGGHFTRIGDGERAGDDLAGGDAFDLVGAERKRGRQKALGLAGAGGRGGADERDQQAQRGERNPRRDVGVPVACHSDPHRPEILNR